MSQRLHFICFTAVRTRGTVVGRIWKVFSGIFMGYALYAGEGRSWKGDLLVADVNE